MTDELLIGLVSISDRASRGVYEDKGMPALTDGSRRRCTTPCRMRSRG